MAYAGTPTGLAQQAGASRPWKTALAAIAVLAIGLALVIAVMFINSRAVAPATGRNDGQIEAQRDATLLSAAAMKHAYVAQDSLRGLPPVTPFASEDKPAVGTSSAAFLNAAAAKARAMSGVPADNSLDAAVRAAAAKASLAGDSGVDKGYGTVQNGRGTSQIWSTFDASEVDQSRGAHGPLK
jgi:hypothetical protein